MPTVAMARARHTAAAAKVGADSPPAIVRVPGTIAGTGAVAWRLGVETFAGEVS